jgi:Uma2 family endonuclease
MTTVAFNRQRNAEPFFAWCNRDVVVYAEADDLNPRYSDRPPTLAVEVLTPNDKWAKVTRRLTGFLSRGVAVMWLVDPEEQSVTVWRVNQLPQVFEGEDELTGEPELPGFRCRVADLFYLPGEEQPAGPAQAGGSASPG